MEVRQGTSSNLRQPLNCYLNLSKASSPHFSFLICKTYTHLTNSKFRTLALDVPFVAGQLYRRQMGRHHRGGFVTQCCLCGHLGTAPWILEVTGWIWATHIAEAQQMCVEKGNTQTTVAGR